MAATPSVEKPSFRQLCEERGLTLTHQRQVLYEVMQSIPGHPNPDEIYARVKQRIPVISLATVYKNINLFIEKGVLREVSMHHGSLRVELNRHPHHHVVCSRCKTILDIEEKDLGVLPAPARLPAGFQVERYAIDVIGICAACQNAAQAVPSFPEAN
jgi:Fur family peroxide stress response transcriptional regulator